MTKPRTRVRTVAAKKATLDLVVNKEDPQPSIQGVVVGRLVGFREDSSPSVIYHDISESDALPARSTCMLSENDIGREVALMFEAGDPKMPIVMGLMESRPKVTEQPSESAQKPLDVQLDGERLEFTANKEIVLKCGKATITLTRAGKIIVRGAYLLSRSSGVNRIKGGSVHIN